MVFNKAHIIEVAQNMCILALTDEDDNIIATGVFSSKEDAERAIDTAENLKIWKSVFLPVSEFVDRLQNMIDDLYRQAISDKSGKSGKSRRKH